MSEGASQTTPQGTSTAASNPVSVVLAEQNRNPVKIAKILTARIRELEQQLTRAVPAGAVVLTGDKAKAWETYQALGTPDEVRAKIATVDELSATIAQRDATDARQKLGKAAAKALGWNEDVTTDFIGTKNLTVEMRDVEVEENGATVTRPKPFLVSGEGASAKAEPLDAAITRDFAGYLPALRATSAPADTTAGSGTTSRPARAGMAGPAYPAQRGPAAGAATTGDGIDAILARNHERASAPNALRPAKAAAA